MQIPLKIDFRGLGHSDAIEKKIRQKVAYLEKFYTRITSCRVVVDAPHHHHHNGKLYQVRIDLSVPGKELVVGKSPSAKKSHADIYVAIRDAFDALKRQLQDYTRIRRGNTKHHEDYKRHGRVVRIFPYEGYGFLQTLSGEEVYFHKNAVIDEKFQELVTGQEVRFSEGQGEEGRKATTVEMVGEEGKHYFPRVG